MWTLKDSSEKTAGVRLQRKTHLYRKSQANLEMRKGLECLVKKVTQITSTRDWVKEQLVGKCKLNSVTQATAPPVLVTKSNIRW